MGDCVFKFEVDKNAHPEALDAARKLRPPAREAAKGSFITFELVQAHADQGAELAGADASMLDKVKALLESKVDADSEACFNWIKTRTIFSGFKSRQQAQEASAAEQAELLRLRQPDDTYVLKNPGSMTGSTTTVDPVERTIVISNCFGMSQRTYRLDAIMDIRITQHRRGEAQTGAAARGVALSEQFGATGGGQSTVDSGWNADGTCNADLFELKLVDSAGQLIFLGPFNTGARHGQMCLEQMQTYQRHLGLILKATRRPDQQAARGSSAVIKRNWLACWVART